MRCIYCKAKTRSSKSATCEVCFNNLSPLRRQQLAEYEATMVSNSDSSDTTEGFVKKLPFFIVGLVAFWFLFLRGGSFISRPAPEEIRASLGQSSDPCYQKPRCLIIYVSPWCGACQSEVPFLSEVQSFTYDHPNVGFKVYVGSDQEENLRRFASQIRANTFLDIDGSIGRSLGVSSYPSYYWLDEEGDIIDRPRRGYTLIPGKSQVESYFLGVLEQDKHIIFG